MAEAADTALLDTSVVIDLADIDAAKLPARLAISAVTLAELSAGPHAGVDRAERARRQDRLQRIEALFDPLPFDVECARAYGRTYAQVVASGRKARHSRALDLMVAATALVHDLPLYTRNAKDLKGLEDLIQIYDI